MKIIIILVALLGLPSLLIIAAVKMEPDTVRAWAVVATLACPLVFIGGVVVGNLEARGKISGIDLAMDKLGRTYEHASKTQADIERKRKPMPAPTINVMNAPNGLLPPISHRQIAESDEVIDL